MTLNSLEFYKKCSEVQEHWGHQMPMMVMEEAGELIQAISKLQRATHCEDYDERNCEEKEQALIEEIGDMYISLMALEMYLDIPDIRDRIGKRVEEKLNKKY